MLAGGVNLASQFVFANPLVVFTLAIAFLGEWIASIGYIGVLLVVTGGFVLGTTEGSEATEFNRIDLLFPGHEFYTDFSEDMGTAICNRSEALP